MGRNLHNLNVSRFHADVRTNVSRVSTRCEHMVEIMTAYGQCVQPSSSITSLTTYLSIIIYSTAIMLIKLGEAYNVIVGCIRVLQKMLADVFEQWPIVLIFGAECCRHMGVSKTVSTALDRAPVVPPFSPDWFGIVELASKISIRNYDIRDNT